MLLLLVTVVASVPLTMSYDTTLLEKEKNHYLYYFLDN